jgi:microcystin degradation protein MlrC
VSFRLGIAGIAHETNSYCAGQTPLARFWILRGRAVLERMGGTRTDVGGMLAACAELGATPVPLMVSGANPSGVIEAAAYRALKQEILQGIRGAGALDAIALALHGAGVVDGTDDLEGDLAVAVRRLVGPDVPLVATFDLHGNVSQEMADALDLVLGCHEYPHTDLYERGHEAVAAIPRLLSGELEPRTHVEWVPMLLPTSTTLFGPAREVNELCSRLERRPGVFDCTLFHGFPYTDTPLVGSHVTATAHADRDLARDVAREAARFLWDNRDRFRPTSLSAAEAVERALASSGRPVVINETSDNPGGGAPGDGTHLLRALLDARAPETCFGFIADAEVAAAAHRAGVGATLEIALGGKTDELHGAPLRVTATVKTLCDGRFVLQEMLRGVHVNLGPSARLRIGGLDVIVAPRSQQTFDPEVFLIHGIDVRRQRIVALKSSNHFRAGFQSLAHEIVTADPPGLTTHHVEIFPRKRSPRPLWPLDPETSYPAR